MTSVRVIGKPERSNDCMRSVAGLVMQASDSLVEVDILELSP